MKELTQIYPRQEVATFEPEQMRTRGAQADAIIEFAKKTKNWPLLEDAVDTKLDDQTAFIQWWDENVGVRQSPGGADRASNADLRSMLSRAAAEDLTKITQQQVSRWRKRLKDRNVYRAALFSAAYKKAMMEEADANHRAEGTGENEWYTPAEFIEKARLVLGDIDLDPASNPIAQQTVNATNFFTKENDGLMQEWHGRVWLNPPYAQPAIEHFIDKLIAEHQDGRTTAAVCLTHNYTDTAWHHKAVRAATAFCLTRGRIRFVSPTGELASPTQGQTFFYFGKEEDQFAEVFSQMGVVCCVKPMNFNAGEQEND